MDYIDYYKILGVPRNATQEEIQRAYRKRARKYHPDVNKEKDAEAEFKKINEANEVLKDPEKRKRYDTYGRDWQNGAQRRTASNGGRCSGGATEAPRKPEHLDSVATALSAKPADSVIFSTACSAEVLLSKDTATAI